MKTLACVLLGAVAVTSAVGCCCFQHQQPCPPYGCGYGGAYSPACPGGACPPSYPGTLYPPQGAFQAPATFPSAGMYGTSQVAMASLEPLPTY